MSSIAQTIDDQHWNTTARRPLPALILLLALAIHGVVLLIPRQQRTPAPPSTLHLDVRYAKPPAAVAPEETVPEPAPETKPIEMPGASPRPAPAQDASFPPAVEPAPRADERRALTTALLLEQFRLREWPPEGETTRILGLPDIPDLPWNLARPVLPMRANAFDDYVLSSEPEIIDQWMEPSGVVNAVVRMPNGDILCASAQPWDPMDPLVEHVAMYRTCGGGGRRRVAARSPFSIRE